MQINSGTVGDRRSFNFTRFYTLYYNRSQNATKYLHRAV